jgi:hypothetical protein
MYKNLLIGVLTFFVCTIAVADESITSTYKSLVDDTGNIALPKNFRTDWTFLGTWSIAAKDMEKNSSANDRGAAGLHNVYTQKEAVEYFQKNKKFLDGTVIIKELLKTETAPMTTGVVSRGSEVEGWFIMIKDTKGRFSSNPLWGDGWGWALFNADQPLKTVTHDYKTECLGCHVPARNNDWIYTLGYPLLTD